MMHLRRLGYERVELDTRQAPSPCPNRNGTTIGTAQTFTILCGSDIGGNVLDSIEAFDLQVCADLCSSFHPRCDGASFDGTACQLRARLAPGAVRSSRRLDSVVGIFPSATSNCATLGASQSALGRTFSINCGTVVAGFDMVQNFAPTFQDCMGQCSATTGCAGVSFDATLDQGFKNCYLKSAISDPAAVIPDPRVDSALLKGAGNAAPAGQPANPGTGNTGPGVVTVPLPAPTTSGAIFFTPPGLGSTAGGAAPTLATELLPLPTSNGVGGGVGLFFPPSTSIGGFAATPSQDVAAAQGESEMSSNAWIAAPVVGSVAAIALIVISFIMLKRRRLGNRVGTSSSNSSSDSQNPRKRNISRPMAISTLFMSWLPSAGRGSRRSGNDSGSRTRSGMGNFSEITGKQPASRGSMRTSVTGLVRPGLALGGERLNDVEEGGEKRESTPQYDMRNGKMELRNSLNGLGQNRWS
jgi:hypothetical protein